ncbi:hypothetical protein UPYG_G00106990 [Umbra pygmaea]|uniref:Uncharacterized protein n=1 Tax=Umbra pygmaea TaxID=75934 RepID=A0ABD0X231_UMBPY
MVFLRFSLRPNLQRDRSNDSFSNVVEKLFEVIPSVDLYTDSGPERCRTCAVVGNSGNLKGSHYGALIDFCDTIIRINKALTSGFEEDVGCRTTHHIMYPESAIDLNSTTHLILFPFKTLDLQWLPGAITNGSTITFGHSPIPSKINANKDLVLVLHPRFMKYVHEVWLNYQGNYPSSGFMALILALHICDEVKVFGFGPDKEGNIHHYFNSTDKILVNQTTEHSFKNEFKVIMKLSEIQKIEFYKGW